MQALKAIAKRAVCPSQPSMARESPQAQGWCWAARYAGLPAYWDSCVVAQAWAAGAAAWAPMQKLIRQLSHLVNQIDLGLRSQVAQQVHGAVQVVHCGYLPTHTVVQTPCTVVVDEAVTHPQACTRGDSVRQDSHHCLFGGRMSPTRTGRDTDRTGTLCCMERSRRACPGAQSCLQIKTLRIENGAHTADIFHHAPWINRETTWPQLGV